MINQKNRLLLPLACCAVISVATFSGIGLAAITGQLSMSPDGEDLFAPSTQLDEFKARAGADSEATGRPTHLGLTRSAINNAGDDEKVMVVRVGQRFSQTLRPPCSRCGVVDSIERHELQMPSSRSSASSALQPGGDNSFSTADFLRGHDNVHASANSVATSFIVRLRMEDGSVRTIYEHQRPAFSVGEKIELVNGSVVSSS